ncbi:MAG TPA: NAD(P)-dependent oxidoreductase [Longimicrobium sp.]|jgi:3-hydroxyisobutyrate dehydrogenase-like beta-hydroxyacid dehydrogenase
MTLEPISFIGLGEIGYPVAGHLATQGRAMIVYNRTPAKSERWCAQHGGSAASSAAEAANGSSVIFICVGDDNDVLDVILGRNGVINTVEEGAVVVDHTTASASIAQQVAQALAEKGVGFLDAPVSGGSVGAQKGVLSVMVGGDESTFTAVQPLMQCYSSKQSLMGPIGSGQMTKMVNQILIASVVQGLAEGIHFGQTLGLDMERVLQVLAGGAAQSWQLENRGPTMLQRKFDFGFAVDLIRKDLSICLNEARRRGATLPITAIIEQFYANLQARGLGGDDFTRLLSLLESSNGSKNV